MTNCTVCKARNKIAENHILTKSIRKRRLRARAPVFIICSITLCILLALTIASMVKRWPILWSIIPLAIITSVMLGILLFYTQHTLYLLWNNKSYNTIAGLNLINFGYNIPFIKSEIQLDPALPYPILRNAKCQSCHSTNSYVCTTKSTCSYNLHHPTITQFNNIITHFLSPVVICTVITEIISLGYIIKSSPLIFIPIALTGLMFVGIIMQVFRGISYNIVDRFTHYKKSENNSYQELKLGIFRTHMNAEILNCIVLSTLSFTFAAASASIAICNLTLLHETMYFTIFGFVLATLGVISAISHIFSAVLTHWNKEQPDVSFALEELSFIPLDNLASDEISCYNITV